MAKQKLNFRDMGRRAVETGQQLAQQDREHEQTAPAMRVDLPIERITARPGGDTRAVDPFHLLGLAESMAAIGLLEPVVVDVRDHLVAGAHRLGAVRLLASERRVATFSTYLPAPLPPAKQAEVEARLAALPADPGPWRMVPVHRLGLDAIADPSGALAAEVAENERRRDYARGDIQALAERLKDAGFKHTRGRPKAGEKSLIPALEVIVGKSKATLWRALSGETTRTVNVSDETFTRAVAAVDRHIVRLMQAPACRDSARLLRGLEQAHVAAQAWIAQHAATTKDNA